MRDAIRMGARVVGRVRLRSAALALLALVGGACKERAAAPASAPAGFFRFGPPPPALPKRIVSLAPSTTEILFAVGAGPRVVGVTRFCDFPAAAAGLPKVGGFLDVSVEAVARLQPELVVGVPNATNRAAIESIARLGIPVLLGEAHRLGEVYDLIAEIGGAAGSGAEAKKLVLSMRREVVELSANVHLARKVKVLFAYGRDPLVVAGPGSFAGELIDLAGGQNVVAESGPPYRSYSIERVLALQPEVLLDSSMGAEGEASSADKLAERWGRFASLPAVQKRRLHWVPPSLFARPGPRLVQALEQLSRILHPRFVASAPRAVVPKAAQDAGAPAAASPDAGAPRK